MSEEKKTWIIRPTIAWENLEKFGIKCGACDVQLDIMNTGVWDSKEQKLYALGSSFFLASYGMFCNNCTPYVLLELESRERDSESNKLLEEMKALDEEE